MAGAILTAFDRQPEPNAEADLEALKRRHTEVTESLFDLARDRYVKRTLPADVFDQMSAELTKEMQLLEAALQPKVLPKATGDIWDWILGTGFSSFEESTKDWSVQERFDALAELIKEIRIGSGTAGRRGFDPARVEMIFRPPFDQE